MSILPPIEAEQATDCAFWFTCDWCARRTCFAVTLTCYFLRL